MENPIVLKSYAFSLRIIQLYKFLCDEKKEFTLSKQVLRSGTSIGANVEEATAGQSKKDFIAKMYIAFKEARETHYWLRLLKDSGFIEEKLANSFLADNDELIRMLSSITKTARENLGN
jgi:four helix bundle protein